ncbi:DUF7282 domain-containing protein [Natrinema ejinorense]|uniref:DUF7282 domain-containing protein n=1 Tax=Natrinema ejinorense TaxID=373386 RepID=A0A2A5QST2_9EURY|nr:hypothetical protein [Natrinema ejinorense]PCR89898.1 hypothetical protein CP557_04700 [Natrinema ejinorense]
MPRPRPIGVAVVVTLVLLSGASIAFAATDAGVATQENRTENETATVTFENQTSNGTAVVVNDTSLPEGGFAVIHAAAPADGDNATEDEVVTNVSEEYDPGEVLGNSTFLEPGDHENVTVELNESLEESQVLIAMAHQDTNDNQTYEFPEADDPYVTDGEPVIDDALITLEETADGTNETADTEMTNREGDESTA